MKLSNGQRDILRSKIVSTVNEVPDDCLIAWLVLLGYSLDQIDQFLKDFS